MRYQSSWRLLLILSMVLLPASLAGSLALADPQAVAPASVARPATSMDASPAPARIDFAQETLPNGLRVIYAPLHQAPVVHVRVVYHVGSRDERPDRQGFAHMFEHMMFSGSAHVKPDEHEKLIKINGGYANAFTSFDTTQYVNTVPANQLELALYLEADRMASFKVSDEIFQTERKVVAEEWRIQQNQPYGKVPEDFLKLAFTKHPYRWSPIGNMDHLAAAKAEELQEFFNRYYVPNNAVLVISGDIDAAAARKLVSRYFGWIPRGEPIVRDIPAEPEQTEPKRGEVTYTVPLAVVAEAYGTPGYGADDDYALALLATILGQGESSRLYHALVSADKPLCVGVQASHMELEDHGGLIVGGAALAGKSADDVEKTIQSVLAEVCDKGVTDEELAKARTLHRVSLIRGRETAQDLASQLGEEATLTGNPNRVNTALARLEAVTREDVQAAARRYIRPDNSITLRIKPSLLAAVSNLFKGKEAAASQLDAAASQPSVQARKVLFPEGYPTRPPMSDSVIAAKFARGAQMTIEGVRVIVMEDHRLPLVNWNLTMRCGSHCEPAGKEGLGDLVAALVTRGAGGLSYAQLSEDLESRSIDISVSDHGDYTRLSGSCATDQVAHAMLRSRQVLLEPALPLQEFNKLKTQTISSLRVSQEEPGTVADEDLRLALYGNGVLGRHTTPQSVTDLTLEDVTTYHKRIYRPNDAFLIVSGDVTVERGQELARQLLKGWEPADLPTVDYTLPKPPEARRIILVDRPSGEQSKILIGIPAYTNRSEERYAGSVAGKILSDGLDSRLYKYLRGEKGLAYGVGGSFSPGRHAGSFRGSTDTSLPTTFEAVEAMFKVLDDMCSEPVTTEELRQAKTRVAGGMVMGIQTISQQAGYRADVILNDYPVDYYDTYPARIASVTPEQIQEVMKRYVKNDRMVLVVVAPADKVKEQLSKLGEVEVVPMPAERKKVAVPATQPTTQPAKALRPAA